MDSKVTVSAPTPARQTRHGRSQLLALLALLLASNFAAFGFFFQPQRLAKLPLNSEETVAHCRSLHVKPAPPPSFNLRTQSDRFQPGTRPVLLKNATIWTGRVDGLEVLKGDILMEGGIIVAAGVVKQKLSDMKDYDIVDAQVCMSVMYPVFVSPPIRGHGLLPGASVVHISRR